MYKTKFITNKYLQSFQLQNSRTQFLQGKESSVFATSSVTHTLKLCAQIKQYQPYS